MPINKKVSWISADVHWISGMVKSGKITRAGVLRKISYDRNQFMKQLDIYLMEK
jgi:hypothetical protein